MNSTHSDGYYVDADGKRTNSAATATTNLSACEGIWQSDSYGEQLMIKASIEKPGSLDVSSSLWEGSFTIDPTDTSNQFVIVSDNAEYYTFNGNKLTLDEYMYTCSYAKIG